MKCFISYCTAQPPAAQEVWMLQAVKDEKHREAIAAESGPQARLRDIAAFSARKQDGLLLAIRA
ncbi:hypothetical protein [Clostridium sp. DFI.1.208]|uniref:hypothetical protein n=1 Tax=Clostridium TaxID=1485 RepID=UPI001E5EFCE2|nr:hypothetical protein [[Clostridium] innocuum]MCQ5276155.1 hypothetical protein [Clostridium sp. DFI.1.208]MCC2843753.1 hypothetical protein [[Clostridium] innocuum]MCC2847632.1 hypothetical protein [[Clostridium] innocuum]MCC2852013.1 hypothetical protein [[Clostridium] innocuum]MCG4659901.1 hypothetical protein [[Clostridium] innocuum]